MFTQKVIFLMFLVTLIGCFPSNVLSISKNNEIVGERLEMGLSSEKSPSFLETKTDEKEKQIWVDALRLVFDPTYIPQKVTELTIKSAKDSFELLMKYSSDPKFRENVKKGFEGFTKKLDELVKFIIDVAKKDPGFGVGVVGEAVAGPFGASFTTELVKHGNKIGSFCGFGYSAATAVGISATAYSIFSLGCESADDYAGTGLGFSISAEFPVLYRASIGSQISFSIKREKFFTAVREILKLSLCDEFETAKNILGPIYNLMDFLSPSKFIHLHFAEQFCKLVSLRKTIDQQKEESPKKEHKVLSEEQRVNAMKNFDVKEAEKIYNSLKDKPSFEILAQDRTLESTLKKFHSQSVKDVQNIQKWPESEEKTEFTKKYEKNLKSSKLLMGAKKDLKKFLEKLNVIVENISTMFTSCFSISPVGVGFGLGFSTALTVGVSVNEIGKGPELDIETLVRFARIISTGGFDVGHLLSYVDKSEESDYLWLVNAEKKEKKLSELLKNLFLISVQFDPHMGTLMAIKDPEITNCNSAHQKWLENFKTLANLN